MTDDVMILDVFTPDDGSAKIKRKEKENGNKNHFHPARCFVISSVA